ncbi:MAG TPA: class I SAM-dependent methyltransferase [Bryobacteraceae bacterium]
MREEFLKEVAGPIANRPQDAILPHIGYRIWAATYDDEPNPILSLEMRVLAERIGEIAGTRILDAGSGTGRWMEWATERGACVFGIDACPEMVLNAERKPGLRGRSAIADIRSIPLADDSVKLALCSFTIGYLPSPDTVFHELARVSRQVIVSDIHPEAVRAGWTRSFRAQDRVYELVHHHHSVTELDNCAQRAGLSRKWRIEASFGESEREVFRRAGKEHTFYSVRQIPAVLITAWQK